MVEHSPKILASEEETPQPPSQISFSNLLPFGFCFFVCYLCIIIGPTLIHMPRSVQVRKSMKGFKSVDILYNIFDHVKYFKKSK